MNKKVRAFQVIGDILALLCSGITALVGYEGISWPAFVQVGFWTALMLLTIGVITFIAISIKLILLAVGNRD